jgi:hypothetical protein
MRNRLYKLCYLIVVILAVSGFYGCVTRQNNDNIAGLWNIDNQGADEDRVADNAFLNLREDKTYTFYQPCYFDYGKWSFDGHKIKLVSDRKRVLYNKVWELDVVDKDKNVLKVTYPFADEKGNIVEPSKDDARERIVYKVHKNIFLRRNDLQFPANRDPFSVENSRWRMRPDHEENCKELQSRVAGSIHHLCVLFARYSDTTMETVSWQHSPHPFILGSNGVALRAARNMTSEWDNIFYNDANAGTAHDILSALFREDIDVPLHIKKYTDMWYPILHQMDSIVARKDMCGN